MNDSKCNFFQQKIKYIEHTILKDRYQAYPDDAVALENFRKPPKTVGELRSRLGFFGYYRGYVKNFSIILKPLNNILKGESNSQEIKTLTKEKPKEKPEEIYIPPEKIQQIIDDLRLF